MDNKKQGLILLVISILVVTIGLTYAYYSASVQGTGNTNAEASATTATLGEVEFNGDTTFDTTNIGRDIYPGFIGVQTFTIAPYNDGHGIYEIDLEANVPAAFGSDIKITLYKTSDATNNNIESEEGSLTITNNQYVKQDTLTITGTLEKVYEGTLTDTDETMLEQVEFLIENNEFTTPDTTPDGYYTYYAVYEYINRETSQNTQQGLDFDAKITVKYILEKTRYANEAILSLAGNADPTSTAVIDNGSDASGCTNTLAYDDYGNLRFVGSNPCNYVTFNEETAGWRIIGVFEGKIKLVRQDSIGEYSWDSSLNTGNNNSSVNKGQGINQWGPSTKFNTDPYEGADLMRELNDYYWNSTSGNCYNDYGNNTDTAYVACIFDGQGNNIKGLATVQNYIDNYTWKTGYLNSDTIAGISAQELYTAERSDNLEPTCDNWPTCNDHINKTTSWQGNIALIYPSDFNYAVGGDARTNCLEDYFNTEGEDSSCSEENYLAIPINHKWGLSPLSHESYNTFATMFFNDISSGDAASPGNVHPSFYLKSSVEIAGGSGTSTNPYTLKIG